MRMNELYIPAPTRKAAALTVQTPRMRIIFMSTSGSLACCSLKIHQTNTTTAPANRPTMRASDQPHDEPWLIASSRQTSQPDRSAAPSQFTLPGDLIGDSGTKKTVITV